jgi:hypothetical protein
MLIRPEHHKNCHPEHEHAHETTEGHTPQDIEPCWHCGTPTDQGCYCLECADNADYIAPGAVYHCKLCNRWWAYMTGLNVTTITFTGTEP